jgi:phosphoribosylaminoimidazole carboxylase (NCAIR synthetase)
MTLINPNQAIAAGEAVKVARRDSRPSRRKEALEQTVQLGREYSDVVKKAQQDNSDSYPQTVQQARELLLKGHFDTDQAAREAAQNIAEYGI